MHPIIRRSATQYLQSCTHKPSQPTEGVDAMSCMKPTVTSQLIGASASLRIEWKRRATLDWHGARGGWRGASRRQERVRGLDEG